MIHLLGYIRRILCSRYRYENYRQCVLVYIGRRNYITFVVCASLLCFASIIGIPFGIQCLKFAGFVLYPFGRSIEYSSKMGHFFLNILWIMLCGWEIAIASFCIGLIWCATVVGIPFGVQSIKFAQLAIMPFGAEVVKT